MLDPDPDVRVGFRIVAPFGRLRRRGYVRLLLRAGPTVAASGARHGVGSLTGLARLVRALRAAEPASWEAVRAPDGEHG